ncbi:hypothetical protein D3C81_902660 [compost metagenome]
MDQPRFLTRAKRPDPAFIAVILGINTAEQGNRFSRHLRVDLPARVQLLPFQLLALILFPRFAQGGVDEGFELAPILLDLEPFRDDFSPGHKLRVHRPDMESHRTRRLY